MADRLEAAVVELVAALRAEMAADVRDRPDRLLSVEEAGGLLDLGRSKTYDLIASGELRSLSVGRRRLVASSAVADYIASRSNGAA